MSRDDRENAAWVSGENRSMKYAIGALSPFNVYREELALLLRPSPPWG